MLPHFESLLAESDEVLFLHGACHIFALALVERFDYALRIVQEKSAKLPKGAMHVFCTFDPARGIDVLGLFEESQRLFEHQWQPPDFTTYTLTTSELQRFTTRTSGGGLYMDNSFVDKARIRAFKLIDRFPEHYSGRDSTPIPGLQRDHSVDVRSLFSKPPGNARRIE